MIDTVLLDPKSAESIVRVIEATPKVRRRHQFFVWTQNELQVLLPHDVAVCGAYQRSRGQVAFEAFHSVAIPPPVLALLTDATSPLMQRLVALWLAGRGETVMTDLVLMAGDAEADGRAQLIACGLTQLIMHGVTRPQRPLEIESLFLFARQRQRSSTEQLWHLELLLPYLHSTYLRVLATERELNLPAVLAPMPLEPGVQRGVITDREREILGWVRQGKSNQEIGELLDISALTVKNHVQRILRKLGAANRAQAVAQAMTLKLLSSDDPPAPR